MMIRLQYGYYACHRVVFTGVYRFFDGVDFESVMHGYSACYGVLLRCHRVVILLDTCGYSEISLDLSLSSSAGEAALLSAVYSLSQVLPWGQEALYGASGFTAYFISSISGSIADVPVSHLRLLASTNTGYSETKYLARLNYPLSAKPLFSCLLADVNLIPGTRLMCAVFDC